LSDQLRYRNKVAIVGIGITRTVRHSDVTVGNLAVQASGTAIRDSGLTRGHIDGIACGTSLPAYGSSRVMRQGVDFVDCTFLADHMELNPSWFLDDFAFPPAFLYAVQAVASGAAKYVLVNRTLHNPQGRYNLFTESKAAGQAQWTAPYGYVAPTQGIAMTYMEYQQRFGARREHMATLALQLRKNVQRIPSAYWYGKELTFDDYMTCRMISEPMCLFDNDIPVDGAGSLILTTAERAKDLPNKPVYITGWAVARNAKPTTPGTQGPLDDYYDRGQDLAERLWSHSGWRPEDVQVPQLYDGFTPLVLFWLEVLGFCPIGEAWSFIQDGRIDSRGKFPLLSGGGNQGWGRLHGFPHVLECYVQLSGRAGERQIPGAITGLSTYNGMVKGQAILYSADPGA
jgi:acetyl-CoA acetyltransferase